MVIAKPEWFARRKYGGWGLYPKTWQGMLYTVAIALISLGIIYVPLDTKYKIALAIVWAIILLIDIGSAMIKIKDEREKIHEAIAERNALWAVLIVLVVGMSFQIASSTVKNDYGNVDIFLVAALVVALIVKAISNIWLDRKN